MQVLSFKNTLFFVAMILTVVSGCKKSTEIPAQPTTATPYNYNFNNVNYTAQTVRVKLLDSLMLVINAAALPGKVVTKDQLEKIFRNEGNKATVNLDQAFSENDKTQILVWFDSVAVQSNGSTKGADIFINHEGSYLPQLIERRIVGHVFYNHAISNLKLLEGKNNLIVQKDTGTAMEHSWDEAFGYFGAPIVLDSTLTDEQYLTKYGKSGFSFMTTASRLDTGYRAFSAGKTDFTKNIYKSFVVGRNAISRNDVYSVLLERDKIIQNWERLIAASAITNIEELKICLKATNESAVNVCRSRKWTELKGNIETLQYNTSNRLGQSQDSNSNYSKILNLIGNKSSSVIIENLDEAKMILKSTYGF